MQQHLLLTVAAVRMELPGIKTIVFEPHPGLQYAAGQFLTVLVPQPGNKPDLRRPYSFSSAPLLGEPPAITIKRIPNGYGSRWLFDRIASGDVVATAGAAGLFTLPDAVAPSDLFFFWAAGIGITPIVPLVQTLLLQHPDVQLRLVYSSRSQAETLFGPELEHLATDHADRFQLLHLHSTAQALHRARLHRSLIPELLQELAGGVPGAQQWHYICGPLDYRRMAAWGLEEAGIPTARIKKEIFQVDQPAARAVPPDTQPHRVRFQADGAPQDVLVSYPETILTAALKAGVALPYSCETGRCGSCAMTCTSGQVWHSYNEVLTEAELKRGTILTCTGHPVGGDVTLQPF